MTGSGLTSMAGGFAEARLSLSGIISHMILPTGEGFGAERLLTRRGRRPAGGDWSGRIDNGPDDLDSETKDGR